MKQLLYSFLLLITFSVSAQDFSLVRKKTDKYINIKNSEALAQKISTDFNSTEQQVKALFYWITHNIKYDLDSHYNPKQKRFSFKYRDEQDKLAKLKAIKSKIANETLVSKKGVCEGYAQIFSRVCSLLNIENSVIKGYVKNSSHYINKPEQTSNHAWNAVKINNEWKYFDTTWASGVVINNVWKSSFNSYYYNFKKEKYFKTHYPEETIWQLKIGSLSKDGFYNQPIYKSAFLKTDISLISPTNGALPKNKPIEIKLKNITNKNTVFIGFSGDRYVTKPDNITTKNNITTIKVNSRKNSSSIAVIVDKKIILEYLLQ